MKIFAGEQEIAVSTKTETFRDQEFSVIHINGERTSITTQMGKDWKFWQAIREVYCNAIDEGGYSLDFVQEITPVAGETHFYIDTKKDVLEFVTNFDNYFATKKKVLFECQHGRILEKSGTEANIYRKGIKCFITNKTSVFDYDFTDIHIDENRLVSCWWQVEEKIWKLLYACTDKDVIMRVLHHSGNPNYQEGCISDISTINAFTVSEEFKECLKTTRLCPTGYGGLLKEDERHNHVLVPTKIFNAVRELIPEANLGDRFRVSRTGAMYREFEATELQLATIAKAMEFFKECEFSMPYEIKTAMFDEKDVMGAAIDDKVYLSDICLDRGVNEVVNTIIEEFIHIKYNCQDETRKFQTSVIAELITYMKTKTAFLI